MWKGWLELWRERRKCGCRHERFMHRRYYPDRPGNYGCIVIGCRCDHFDNRRIEVLTPGRLIFDKKGI